MTNPFATPEDLLKTSRRYNLEPGVVSSEDFFIDKKYQGSINRLLNNNKMRLSFLIVLFVLLALWARVFHLQINRGEYYHALAEGNRIRSEVIASPRGIFYDRNGQQLTENLPSFSVAVERELLTQIAESGQEEIWQKISWLSGLTIEQIKEEANKFLADENKTPILDFEISYAQGLYFLAHREDFANLQLSSVAKRKYLGDASLSHILGYLGRINRNEWTELKKLNYQFTDLIGKAGLEAEYETWLKGVPGRIDHEVDALGREVNVLKKVESVAGDNLILTIDAGLNKKLAEELTGALKKNGLTKAAAVAIEPNSGEILAMVSLPDFESNYFSETAKYSQEITGYLTDKNQPLFNRVIAGEFPSGSTIKPVFAAAGLEEGVITKNTTVLSVGGIRIDKWYFPDWKAGGHGVTNVIKALAESVNTFFYYIGGGYLDFEGLGLEKMMLYAKKFGFGALTGIDLPGENDGFIPTKEWKLEAKGEEWYIGDTYHVSIGQGDILVTPLQIANMTAAIANGGKLYKLHLVKRVVSSDGQVQNIRANLLSENMVSNYNMDIIREGMRQTVVSGSARYLSDLPFSSAGKTGTAQVGGLAKPHAWFTAFAPFEQPQIAITILMENGNEGSTVAVPVAKEVLRWYMEKNKRY